MARSVAVGFQSHRQSSGTGGSKLETGNLGQGSGEKELGGRELGGNWRAGTGGSKLGTGNLGQGTGDRELGAGTGGTGGSKLGTGNLGQGRTWGQQTGDRELGTGNWGQGTGTGDRELGAGNWALLCVVESVFCWRRWNHGPEVAEC